MRRLAAVSDANACGGAEAYLATLLGELRDGYDVTALVAEAAPAETCRRLGRSGAQVVAVPGLGRRLRPRSVSAVRSALRAARPDVVLLNLTDQGDGLPSLLAVAAERLPTVVTANLWVPTRARWRERVSAAALRAAQAVIVPSQATATQAARYRLPVVVIPHGLAVPDYLDRQAARAALGVPRQATVVGGLGRLTRQKGWDLLVAAAERLRSELPEVQVVVVGDGALADRLVRLDRRGLVRFVGHREDAATLVRAFDVLAVPSRYESFGLVAVEAALAGVPVVAAAAGGLAEAVGEEGVLVPTERADLLAAALREVLTNPTLARARAARARTRAHELFAASRMARQTDELLRMVGPPRSPRAVGRRR